ncbi:MAG TPA: hypothetical protein PKH93_11310 [Chitinophagales bacterium]|nr:hypothetical protein [Chitinophagales bacterium]
MNDRENNGTWISKGKDYLPNTGQNKYFFCRKLHKYRIWVNYLVFDRQCIVVASIFCIKISKKRWALATLITKAL